MAGSKNYSGIDFQNRGKIENLPNGVSAGDGVNKGQLDSAIEGLKNKDPVVVASQVNIVIATALNNADVLDGITLATGDRVLVKSQTATAENGIYIVGVSPARSADANTATELNNAIVEVIGGTDANTVQRQTATVVTLGTDPVTFAQFGVVTTPAASETVAGKAELATQAETNTGTDDLRIVTPLKLKTNLDSNQVSGTVGDGSTQNPVITHNLATKSIHVSLYLTATPYTNVDIEFERTDTNTITLKVVGSPLSSGEVSYFISRR